jgi:GNAT superfamily N-acetyltransferase
MFTIRRSRQEDAQSIRNVHVATVEGIRTALYTHEEISAWAVPKDRESYEDSIRNSEFFVAEEDGDILGFGVLNQQNAVVEALYVIPKATGRGIGLKLLRMLEERACVLGLKALRLDASLNAVPFYKRAGYVGEKETKYRLYTGVEIACVPMVKSIETDANDS